MAGSRPRLRATSSASRAIGSARARTWFPSGRRPIHRLRPRPRSPHPRVLTTSGARIQPPFKTPCRLHTQMRSMGAPLRSIPPSKPPGHIAVGLQGPIGHRDFLAASPDRCRGRPSRGRGRHGGAWSRWPWVCLRRRRESASCWAICLSISPDIAARRWRLQRRLVTRWSSGACGAGSGAPSRTQVGRSLPAFECRRVGPSDGGRRDGPIGLIRRPTGPGRPRRPTSRQTVARRLGPRLLRQAPAERPPRQLRLRRQTDPQPRPSSRAR